MPDEQRGKVNFCYVKKKDYFKTKSSSFLHPNTDA
jgi:hypothetical protein